MNNNAKFFGLRFLSAVLVTGLMVFAAQFSGESEIIFPEITAICVGAILAPKQSWNASAIHIFATITIMSFVGVAIVIFMPVGKPVQLLVGLLFALVGLTVSECGFVPQVSACVLPIVLGTTSVIYPLSASALTALVLLIQSVFQGFGKLEKREFEPQVFSFAVLKTRVFQFLGGGVVLFLAAVSGQIYFAVPPLLVGFLEMSTPKSKLISKRGAAIFLIFLGALMGTVCRLLLTAHFGLPLALSAMLAAAIVFLAMKGTGVFFPPAAAISTLPMLLPTERLWLYPVEATAGFIVLSMIAFFRAQRLK